MLATTPASWQKNYLAFQCPSTSLFSIKATGSNRHRSPPRPGWIQQVEPEQDAWTGSPVYLLALDSVPARLPIATVGVPRDQATRLEVGTLALEFDELETREFGVFQVERARMGARVLGRGQEVTASQIVGVATTRVRLGIPLAILLLVTRSGPSEVVVARRHEAHAEATRILGILVEIR